MNHSEQFEFLQNLLGIRTLESVTLPRTKNVLYKFNTTYQLRSISDEDIDIVDISNDLDLIAWLDHRIDW